MRSKEHREVKREERDAMELLDHHWFFHNILCYEPKILLSKPSSSRSTPPKETATIPVEGCNFPTSKPLEPQEHRHHHHHHHQARRHPLLRQPLLTPDVGLAASPIKVNHPTKQKKLHRSFTSPQDASPSYTSCENYVHHHHHHHHHHHQHKTIDDSRREREDGGRGMILMARKWKSLSDLEHEEVRGFEDLGFVFGRGDRLNPILLKMIPGLRDRGEDAGSEVRRPYLSEAWFARRPAPLVINNWGRQRSAAEMKEQLKFWARAVATNMRQEC